MIAFLNRRLVKRRRRTGATLVEATAALALFATAGVAFAQLVALAAAQTRQIERREVASRELANWMEKAAMLSYEETNSKSLAGFELRDDVRALLPDAHISASVVEEEGSLHAKRIRLTIHWKNSAQSESVSVMSWRHRRETAR